MSNNNDATINDKTELVKNHFRRLKSGLVALSGGVDSSVLLLLASETPSFTAYAATVVSEAHPDHEIAHAIEIAHKIGVPHYLIELDELSNPNIRANGPLRCYYCKLARYSVLQEKAQSFGLASVWDGSNADDADTFRPGAKAIQELGIQTPLQDAGLRKQEICLIAEKNNLLLQTANSTACLYTRIPLNEPLDKDRLNRITKAEKFLMTVGFNFVRVRDHGPVARLELLPDDILRFVNSPNRHEIVRELKLIGYKYVTIDASGYVMGSMLQ